ncbi:MAG: hypothetical protein KIT14_25855 [bacterium]|nr:hypothetical protein [bacterium]
MHAAARRLLLSAAVALLLPASPVRAGGADCACRFEVATGGSGVPLRRTTRTAVDGACTFDVRLRVAPGAGAACDGARSTMRGLGRATTVDPWAMSWERVTVRARTYVRRTVLRARLRDAAGRRTRARLALRCAPPLAGCEDVMAEPVYCVLGGRAQHRVASLDTGVVCRDDGPATAAAGRAMSLALWHGDVYACSGGSPFGGFVATPLGAERRRRVAGPCAATGTDATSLLVLPRPGFDARPAQATARRSVRDTPRASLRQIRAYDDPADVPDGPYRVVADLDTIPAGSPCGALLFDTVTGADGLVYATGCRPRWIGGCDPQPIVCVFDAGTGAALPSLTLQEFDGGVRGLSALDGGRLVVLTDDLTALPAIGYGGDDTSFGVHDTLHVFDVTDGARLDSQALTTFMAQGLACVSR